MSFLSLDFEFRAAVCHRNEDKQELEKRFEIVTVGSLSALGHLLEIASNHTGTGLHTIKITYQTNVCPFESFLIAKNHPYKSRFNFHVMFFLGVLQMQEMLFSRKL